ncbi:hypothetical protein [Rufibacter quisquiliarum]|uniref:Uncharacterized protein n=1 Tax=Rufibacter quisquiliarum TaxID=1549639 RepID=A0A839GQ93_9BACT|nr:hypothetical protein [Rufibacter quisquiliarum]MBA9076001.1 hypothetical protein [Rufibacter quisquiliarum]
MEAGLGKQERKVSSGFWQVFFIHFPAGGRLGAALWRLFLAYISEISLKTGFTRLYVRIS